MEKIPVLYIVGIGRSGSTILDIALGNHPQLEGVGELSNLVRSAWSDGEYCACKTRGEQCLFWSQVKNEWMKKSGIVEVVRYQRLQTRFEQRRSLLYLLLQRYYPSQSFREYARYTYLLFASISKVCGKPWIVDSSKNPIRALALSMFPEIDLYLIHLIRDGRGVAWSLQKKHKRDPLAGIQQNLPARPVWRTALMWSMTNLLAEWVCRRTHSLRIHYEDFAADPRATLRAIGQHIGVDFSPYIEDMVRQKRTIRHTIAGNRLRMQSKVQISKDERWMEEMPASKQWLFRILGGWMLQRYGY